MMVRTRPSPLVCLELTDFIVLGENLGIEALLKASNFSLQLLLGSAELLDLAALILHLNLSGTLLHDLPPKTRSTRRTYR